MTKKKMLAALTALVCTLSMASIPVFAETEFYNEYFEGESGELIVISARGTYGLLIETGSEEMTLDTLVPFGYVDTSDLEAWQVDIDNLFTLEDFLASNPYCTFDVAAGEGNQYVIKAQYMTNEELIALSRQLMLQLDFVENVQLINYERRAGDPRFPIRFTAKLASADTVLDTSVIPELVDFTYQKSAVDDLTVTLYMDYDPVACYNGEAEYPDFRNQYVSDTENLTEYEEYEYVTSFADSIQEKYSNLFATFEPLIFFESSENGNVFSSSSNHVWTSAGDNNDDGNVTAEDAAGMLTLAAQIGTGADIKATSANDVNADGTVNAEDAAAVLAYAAANGSGNEVSWVDILRR